MKNWLLIVLTLSGLATIKPLKPVAKPDKSIPTFVYHRFGDDRYPSTNISNENFESHLRYLSSQGYKTLTYTEALSYLASRKPAEKVVCLTVDDGYKSFYENGLPLLKKYGFTATVFINTETVGSADYMDWDQLKFIQDSGIEIGNHSHSHDYFLNDSSETRDVDFAEDLMTSQNLIEQYLEKRPEVFAYPYGEFDENLKQIASEVGFIAAAAQRSGVMHTGMDMYETPRFPMSDRYAKLGSFIEKLTMLPIKEVAVETINYGYNGSPTNPRVIFRFPQGNLSIQQIQCFAQGKRCTKSVRIDKNGIVQLTVKSREELTNRRTLYTVTVPDNEGKWHWYSFTWVITAFD